MPVAESLQDSPPPAEAARRLSALRGTLECEQPNDAINDFSGVLTLQGANPLPVGPERMLLRGCMLRNTSLVYGLVVSTGDECKINFTPPGDAEAGGGGAGDAG